MTIWEHAFYKIGDYLAYLPGGQIKKFKKVDHESTLCLAINELASEGWEPVTVSPRSG
jgi:hypothetical protein